MNKLINHKTNIPYLGVLEAWCFFLFKNVSFQREILQPHTIASCPSVGSYNICMAPGTCIIFFLVEILQQSLQVSQDSARWWNPQSSTKIDPSMTQTLVKQSHNLRNNKHHQEDQWIVVRPETLSFRCQQRKLPYSKKNWNWKLTQTSSLRIRWNKQKHWNDSLLNPGSAHSA